MSKASRKKKHSAAGSILPLTLVGGGLALLAAGLNEVAPRPRLIIAGIDLGQVDLRKPFAIQFSAPPHDPRAKMDAIRALDRFVREMHARWPSWLVQSRLDHDEGSFVLYVVPVATPATAIRSDGRSLSDDLMSRHG